MVLVLAAAGAAALAGQSWQDDAAVRDSLSQVHPRLRSRWLNERGLEFPGINAPLPPSTDSGGLRLVGKFGRGPSVEVTGRDSLVFLSLGSEVAIINMADPDYPEVLSEPQAMGLVTQAAVRDSFLYIGCMTGQAGIEVWNVQDPANPVFRSRAPSLLSDFCINDTFLYLTQSNSGLNDTFKVFSIADPESVRLLGSCRDSGDVVTYTNNTAFLGDRWGFYAIDVSNPANPHRVGSYPGVPLSVEARNTVCCITLMNPNQPDWLQFEVLDVSVPATIRRLGYVANAGGYDILLADTLAFLSGHTDGGHEFRLLSIADSTAPRLIGGCGTPGENFGVWVSRNTELGYVADRLRGMALVDIGDLGSPAHDTSFLAAGFSVDVDVDQDRAYVASTGYGVFILNISTPADPRVLGVVDSTRRLETHAVVARDSFAFMHFTPSLLDLRVVDVSDPAQPASVAGVNPFNWAEDLVLLDSFLYVAETNRFEVVNVARPREPVLVGSCVAGDANSAGLSLQDSLAYVGNFVSQIVSVADPANPVVVGTFNRGGWNVVPRDTYAFVSSGGVIVYSIADPTQPRAIDSLSLGPNTYWVEAVGSLLYTGNRDGVHVVDASDVHNMREVGFCSTPYSVKRVHYASPHVYAACWDAGVSIFESTQVAVGEVTPGPGLKGIGLKVLPNPAAGRVRLIWSGPPGWATTLTVRDVLGKEVMRQNRATVAGRTVSLDVTSLASGVYYAEVAGPGRHETVKFVKR